MGRRTLKVFEQYARNDCPIREGLLFLSKSTKTTTTAHHIIRLGKSAVAKNDIIVGTIYHHISFNLNDYDVNVWSAIISSSIIIPTIVYLSKQCQSVLYRQVSSPNLTLRHKPHSHNTFPKYCIGMPSLQILPQEYSGPLPSLGITPTVPIEF